MVQNLWDPSAASQLKGGLDELVYRSNLLGRIGVSATGAAATRP